jgi:hypothetical protein
MISNTKPAFDPRRGVVGTPAPVVLPQKPAAEKTKVEKIEVDTFKPTTDKAVAETPRIVEQKEAATQMLRSLATDARLAGIILNPIFAPHANAIALSSVVRAIHRYETEVPRKDFNALMNEERTAARKEILALPKRYAEATGQAIETTGEAIETGARVTGEAIVTGATATGNAIATGAKAVGQGLFAAGAAVVGGFFLLGKTVLKGFGAGLSGLGKALQGAGDAIESTGK